MKNLKLSEVYLALIRLIGNEGKGEISDLFFDLSLDFVEISKFYETEVNHTFLWTFTKMGTTLGFTKKYIEKSHPEGLSNSIYEIVLKDKLFTIKKLEK